MTRARPRIETKSLAIRGPLSVLGAIAGTLAGGIVMPERCTFTEAQASRLHVTLPIAMPLALLIAASLLARRLAPLPRARRRWTWIPIAIAMTLLGETLFGVAAGFAYEPAHGLEGVPVSFLFFLPLHVALIAIVITLVSAARGAARLRAGSLVHRVARRQVWLAVLASSGPIEALILGLHHKPVSPLAYVVLMASAVAIPVLASVLIADDRAASRLERELANAAARGEQIDLGVPDLDEGVDDAHPYRASPERASTFARSAEFARRLVARARLRSAIALAVAIVGSSVAAWEIGRMPQPKPEESIELPRLFHCGRDRDRGDARHPRWG